MFNPWAENAAFQLYANLFNNAVPSQINAFALQNPFIQQLQMCGNNSNNNSNFNANNYRNGDSASDDEDDETKRTIYCANLDERVTEELLYEVFLQAGPLESVRIPKDNNGRQRTFGFVVYHHTCSVPYALQLLDGLKLFQRGINIKQQNGYGGGSGGNSGGGGSGGNSGGGISGGIGIGVGGNIGGMGDYRRFDERCRNSGGGTGNGGNNNRISYSERDRYRNNSPQIRRSRSPVSRASSSLTRRMRTPPNMRNSSPSRRRMRSPVNTRNSPPSNRRSRSPVRRNLSPLRGNSQSNGRRQQQRYSRHQQN